MVLECISMKLNLLKIPRQARSASFALLVLRVVAGLAFMLHGWSKIQNPFGWMGQEAGSPALLQGLAALSEFGGGLCWILGLLMPIASFGILSTMGVAVLFHLSKGDPFVAHGAGSYELALVYFSIALVLMFCGPGKFSLDRRLFGERS